MSSYGSAAVTACALAAIAALLLAVSQTGAVYDGDEGLHLIAALLVNDGRTPYADFFYWHEPLYLYVAAAWMEVAGETWRSAHVLSALLTAGTAVLIGTFRPAPFAPRGWGLAAACLFALNVLVLKWGTIAHNYALCLLFIVAAFRFTVAAASHGRWTRAWLAGLAAGAATATSLLVVLAGPVLLWGLLSARDSRQRRRTALAFAAGWTVPFVPLAIIAARAPRATFFGLVEHHLFYRVPIQDAGAIQLETLSSWVTSPQALALVLLAAVGLRSIRRAAADAGDRRAFYLAGWLAAAIGAFAALAHPPARVAYFVLVTPFVAIVASRGLLALAAQRGSRRAPWLAAAAIAGFGMGAGLSAYRERLWISEWARVERFADEVNRVTPPGGSFYTSYPFVYVAAGRRPPRGMENPWASGMTLAPERFDTLRIVPAGVIADAVRAGRFDTVLVEAARFAPATLDRVYRQRTALDRYFLLWWDRREGQAPQAP